LVPGMQIAGVLARSLVAPSTPNAVIGAAPSRRIKVNAKVLRAGGFAAVKERLDIHATLAYCRSLKADLSPAFSQQGAEAQVRLFCTLGLV
jgi:hypothetical protein